MFSWATPDYLLEKMSLEQIIYFYNEAWDAKKLDARVQGSYFAMLSNGIDPDDPAKTAPNAPKHSRVPIEEIRVYPGYENAYYNEKGKLIKG
jgi:hypothetical protein